ncbi:hypothetical protein LPBF_06010 [Flavobacterium crassostreae]|uniref:asparagine synthase (glutamine-hydrolyzing) n=2 Tax=Flavobacterium crassostreae TaxID=1763534 RepID=A0A1B9E3H7_9FLAO|nr:hypothetical protein LPBF_06010 [Flavobacterium crassostreae]
MCGINGILHLQSQKKVSLSCVTKMRDALEHRGPDDKGVFIENNLGLGHRRLSILDLSAAAKQPFVSQNQRYIMVYNGEIYNFKDFYPELKNKGFVLKTSSDTEVLLLLYQLYGLEMLPRLNGMFAFAIWDTEQKKLVLARDRMGVKPLYYSFYNQTLYFASEQKALFAAGVPLKIAQDSLEEYVFNRFVAGENTLYQNVKKVLPGHHIHIYPNQKVVVQKWWDLKHEIQNQATIQNPVDWFTSTLDASVKLRMVSDAPVGVLLSGGLDSSSILASLKAQNFKNISTFNIGFKEKQHNESHLAKMLSDQLEYPFETIQLEDYQLYEQLLNATYFQDEPIMHLNEPHLLTIAQKAKSKVKVLLSGEGADELMGGYVRYKPLQYPSLLGIIAKMGSFGLFAQKARYEKLIRYAQIPTHAGLVLYNGCNIYPPDIAKQFGLLRAPQNQYRNHIYQEAKEVYPNNLRRQALYFDQHTYLNSLLDRNDRTTMGAGIECREPFLDQRLITGLGSLDDQWFFRGKKGKYILKTAMQERLPSEILNFKKIGLSAPWGDYLIKSAVFKQELSSFAASELFEMPYFNHLDGRKLVRNFQKGDPRMAAYILPLFMMHIWLKTYPTKF